MNFRNPEHYSGTILIFVWVSVVLFGITFWAGLACLIGRFLK